MNDYSAEGTKRTYHLIEGGSELLNWFGRVPSFHDAEIISLALNRKGESTLLLHGWVGTDKVDEKGYFVLEKHALVTFSIREIFDLQLDGFSHQNVIGSLDLRYGAPNPERQQFYTQRDITNAFEITLEPCFGMDGVIRCKGLSVSFKIGEP